MCFGLFSFSGLVSVCARSCILGRKSRISWLWESWVDRSGSGCLLFTFFRIKPVSLSRSMFSDVLSCREQPSAESACAFRALSLPSSSSSPLLLPPPSISPYFFMYLQVASDMLLGERMLSPVLLLSSGVFAKSNALGLGWAPGDWPPSDRRDSWESLRYFRAMALASKLRSTLPFNPQILVPTGSERVSLGMTASGFIQASVLETNTVEWDLWLKNISQRFIKIYKAFKYNWQGGLMKLLWSLKYPLYPALTPAMMRHDKRHSFSLSWRILKTVSDAKLAGQAKRQFV